MSRHMLLWIILLAVTILLAPVLLPAQFIMNRVNTELEMIVATFGIHEAKIVVDRANRQYDDLFVQTGLVQSVSTAYVEPEVLGHSSGLFPWMKNLVGGTNGYLLSLAGNCYSMLVRLNIFLVWIPFIVPFLLAAIIDGVVKRRIKLVSFGFISPVALGVAAHSLIALVFVPVIYLIAPVAMTPLFVPFWALLIAVPMMLLMANIQRIRG